MRAWTKLFQYDAIDVEIKMNAWHLLSDHLRFEL